MQSQTLLPSSVSIFKGPLTGEARARPGPAARPLPAGGARGSASPESSGGRPQQRGRGSWPTTARPLDTGQTGALRAPQLPALSQLRPPGRAGVGVWAGDTGSASRRRPRRGPAAPIHSRRRGGSGCAKAPLGPGRHRRRMGPPSRPPTPGPGRRGGKGPGRAPEAARGPGWEREPGAGAWCTLMILRGRPAILSDRDSGAAGSRLRSGARAQPEITRDPLPVTSLPPHPPPPARHAGQCSAGKEV